MSEQITPERQAEAKGIGPRTEEYESQVQHFWSRRIDGVSYSFVYVKVSRLGYPWISVRRGDVQVRCSCRRPDCPFTAARPAHQADN